MITEITPIEYPTPVEMNPPTQIPEKDLELLPTLSNLNSSNEVMEKIENHFVQDGRPGSAEYLKLYYMSYLLEEQYKTLKDGGTLPEETMALIDTEATTPEMLIKGKAFLNKDAAAQFLGSFNRLKYHIKTHLDRTIIDRSDYYSKKWLRREKFSEKIDSLFGKSKSVKEDPYLDINDAEKSNIYDIMDRKFIVKEEAEKELQRGLEQMMRNRPGVVGLEFNSDLLRNINNIAETVQTGAEEPMDLGKLKGLSHLLENHGMRELGINKGFGQKIKSAVQLDLHPKENTDTEKQ